MTESQQQRMMQDIFGVMMTSGTLHNQSQMARELKAIHFLLGTQEGLTAQECDNCLLYFFREYAKGCSVPINDDYIVRNMIPIVKNFKSMDLLKGTSLIFAVKNHGVK